MNLAVISLIILIVVVAIGFIKKVNLGFLSLGVAYFKTLFLLSVANVCMNVLLAALGVFNLGGLFY